jgi:hypothetical protein
LAPAERAAASSIDPDGNTMLRSSMNSSFVDAANLLR